MIKYTDLPRTGLLEEKKAVQAAFEAEKSKDLRLNMARGNPSKEQLDLVSGLLTVLTDPADCVVDGMDVRNYGGLSGLPCAKKLFADILGCRPEEVFVGGSSSLQLMYAVISRGFSHGLKNSPRPWCRNAVNKFLCPTPGYDRHFRVTQTFGFELITVPMTENGPDMDLVEEYVKDPDVRGIWCVPKFSNPGGIIYSEETVRRLAALRPAAPDFALMWDNAYCIHEFEGDFIPFADILSLCREYGNGDMVYEFASTAKITFAGGGIGVLAASEENLAYLEKRIGEEIICHDKVNQLRHVLFLKDRAHTLELMKKHAEILRPKYKTVQETLERELAPCGIAEWTHPKGGFFVSVNVMPGTAVRTLELCREAGVVMTNAGAAFPYGKDPQDRNIRIAPSLPPVEELAEAMKIFCLSARLAALEKLLRE